MSAKSFGIAIISVVDDPSAVDDWTGELVAERLATAGYRVTSRAQVPNVEAKLRAQLVRSISDHRTDVVIVMGGVVSGVATRALAPLITDPQPAVAEQLRRLSREELGSSVVVLGAQAAQCGSIFVALLSGALAGAHTALDRAVIPYLDGLPANRVVTVAAPRPVPAPPMTTHSIAVIGDLPEPPAMLNLRAGGRRGMWLLASLAVAAAVGMTAVTVDVARRNQHSERSEVVAATTPRVESPPDAVTPAAPVPATATTTAAPRTPTRPARSATPHRVVSVPRAHAAAEPVAQARVPSGPEVDGACDERSCALHDNERECCAPYRAAPLAVPDRLDRTMVALALGDARARMLECASSDESESVRLQVTVRSDGRVTGVVVEQAPEAGIGECVAAVVRTARFPVTRAGGSFGYTLSR